MAEPQVFQLTAEQLQKLITEAVRGVATTSVNATEAKSKGSFSNCNIRFWGQRDHNDVEEFITSIETYKDVESISDEDALKGLSLLLCNQANIWWQGIRREAKTWQEAIALIREHFSPTKPAYQIYMELFSKKQEDKIDIDPFVVEKRALLAQLPEGRHDEETEVDLVYGLLNIKYRTHIARHDVKTFRELLEQGRIIEHNNSELDTAAAELDANRRGSKRCTFCNYRGHTVDQCRKRKQEDAKND